MLALVFGIIFLVATLWALGVFLTVNPEYWMVVVIVLAILTLGGLMLRNASRTRRIKISQAMGENLLGLSSKFDPIEDSYLSLRPKEKAFYELSGVQLREFRSSGMRHKAGNLGANFKISQGISISGGGISGESVPNPEESTVIDQGTAIFTNQRVVFSGQSQTREWELNKLVGLDIGVAGFTVTPSVSGKAKASGLAGDSTLGITPGILFSIAIEFQRSGEQAARDFAREHGERILDDVRYYYATGKIRK